MVSGASTKENMLLVRQLETYSFSNFNHLVQAISNGVDSIASKDMIDAFEILKAYSEEVKYKVMR